jgi:selenocysteine lyase/cysteine desulfurase
MKNYQSLYCHFLAAHPDVQHFASHSHHYWPDVTMDAHMQYWKDSCQYVDNKWEYFFSTKVPLAQKLIAEVLHLSKPQQIVFAANTHELIYRVLSCFPRQKKIRVLTTDSEFFSFERQILRLEESGRAEVVRVPTLPLASLEERLGEEIHKQNYDFIFLSQVFFNSGVAIKGLATLLGAVRNPETVIMIDGYHGFMALPTDLRQLEDRIFYVAGSYKYAQGGEGCCFMWVPPGTQLRPEYTGWFAGFGQLENFEDKTDDENLFKVQYPNDGYRFAGSTMDYSALYRLISVLELFKREGLNVAVIHSQIQTLQQKFLLELEKQQHPILQNKNLLKKDLSHHGHFLTFQTKSVNDCNELVNSLKEHRIWTDSRGDRLRFGFGLYHDGRYNLTALKNL